MKDLIDYIKNPVSLYFKDDRCLCVYDEKENYLLDPFDNYSEIKGPYLLVTYNTIKFNILNTYLYLEGNKYSKASKWCSSTKKYYKKLEFSRQFNKLLNE